MREKRHRPQVFARRGHAPSGRRRENDEEHVEAMGVADLVEPLVSRSNIAITCPFLKLQFKV